MIKLTINGKNTEIEDNTTVEKFLTDRDNRKAAVWINGKQLLRAEYSSRVIMQGDKIKVLRIVAGG